LSELKSLQFILAETLFIYGGCFYEMTKRKFEEGSS
jgi:hypothetical protein